MTPRIKAQARKEKRSYYCRSLLMLTGALLLLFIPSGAALAQQQCPTIRVFCSDRVAGDISPLRCSAIIESRPETNLTYQWTVTARAPIKQVPGRPDEVEIDLGDNADRIIRVGLIVTGLPEQCEDTAFFDSHLVGGESQPSPSSTVILAVAHVVSATCSESVVEGEPAYFNVNVDGMEQGATPVYNWSLSFGKIKKGQGTQSIAVDTTDLGGAILKASVRVGGESSMLRASCTTVVRMTPKAYQLDDLAGMSAEDESEHLRRFALRLSIGLNERAYIIVLGRRGQLLDEIRRRAEIVREDLIARYGVEPERIMDIAGGFGRHESVQLWIVQTGASPPRIVAEATTVVPH